MTAATKEPVLDTLGGAASKLRNELGESLATVQSFDVPLAEATTTSLEALKAFTLGRETENAKGIPPQLFRSTSAPSSSTRNFTMAYVASRRRVTPIYAAQLGRRLPEEGL